MSSRRFFSFLALSFALLFAAAPAVAQHESSHEHEDIAPHNEDVAADAHDSHGENEAGFDASEVIFGHIGDSHYWHFFDIGEFSASIPLPVIIYHPEKGLEMFSASRFDHGHVSYNGYHLEHGMKESIVSEDGASIIDFSITKNVLSMIISVILLVWIMTAVAKKYKKNGTMKAPSGFQNALEPVITFIRDDVAKPNIGRKYISYMPLLLTLFFFIWINNLLGLIPGGANFTGNIAVTGCLALITFIVMIASGNKHFWGHLLNPPGVPFLVKILLVIIEIISLFIKPIALMIRLFANIMAGHIIILSIVSMIFIFGGLSTVAGWGFAPVSLAFTVFMFFLELLVAAIQAFIFTNLAAVFIGQSVEESHHDHAHDDHSLHNPATGQAYQVSEKEIIA